MVQLKHLSFGNAQVAVGFLKVVFGIELLDSFDSGQGRGDRGFELVGDVGNQVLLDLGDFLLVFDGLIEVVKGVGDDGQE